MSNFPILPESKGLAPSCEQGLGDMDRRNDSIPPFL